VIFNITPSPGATTCLANAYEDVQSVINFFGGEYEFQKDEFEKLYVK
jgi:malate dehydrogenase (quinone)